MKKLMNNKAYYAISDVAMFFLSFLVIGVCIAIGTYIFYNNQVDIRVQEAEILSVKLTKAIVDNTHLENGIFNEDFNLLKKARVNKAIMDRGEFYFKLEILDLNEQVLKTFQDGNRDFEVLCELESDKFPKCYKDEFFLDDYKIKILTASNQIGDKL